MPRYLFTATINVEADNPEEARRRAKALCDRAETGGVGDCVLDAETCQEADE